MLGSTTEDRREEFLYESCVSRIPFLRSVLGKLSIFLRRYFQLSVY